VDPLAHSHLPDAEALVIRNLMDRIDALEGEVVALQECLRDVAAGKPLKPRCGGQAQNLQDRQIIELFNDHGGDP